MYMNYIITSAVSNLRTIAIYLRIFFIRKMLYEVRQLSSRKLAISTVLITSYVPSILLCIKMQGQGSYGNTVEWTVPAKTISNLT